MIRIDILALTLPPSIMFRREFVREIDAADYEAMWAKLGSCHVKRTTL